MIFMADKKQEKKVASKPKVKKSRTADKWKKKQWYNIIAPAEFDKTVIGETVAEKPKNVEGRTIKIDLGQLTGQRQKRYIGVIFKIDRVEGNNASCQTLGHEASPGFVSRLVRRRMSKVEIVQTLRTADNKRVKVKTIALSVRKLSKNQERDVGKKMAEMMKEAVLQKSYVQASQEMIFGAMASKIFKVLTKIAPLKRVEIIKSRVLEGK